MGRTLLRTSAAVIDGALVDDAAVLVDDGVVSAAGPRAELEPTGAEVVTLDGTLLPGFVDIQLNGMGGRGCEEDDPTALDVIARTAWQGGAAAFLPTLITASMDDLVARAARVAAWIERFDLAAEAAVPLGIHIEGPFLEIPGAHDESLLVDPTPARVDALIEACRGHLRLLTLAPGRAGAAEATARLRAAGVTVSLGHAESTTGFAACVEAGAASVTHLFNVMSPLHHRDLGIVGLGLDDERLSCGLIADGIHVHPAVLRTAYKVLGPERTILVTDAANPAGMPDGDYELSGMPVTLTAGTVRDRQGRLAGSALTMAAACASFRNHVPGVDATALAAIAARNPARIARAASYGAIGPGTVARFAVLDVHGEVRALRA